MSIYFDVDVNIIIHRWWMVLQWWMVLISTIGRVLRELECVLCCTLELVEAAEDFG